MTRPRRFLCELGRVDLLGRFVTEFVRAETAPDFDVEADHRAERIAGELVRAGYDIHALHAIGAAAVRATNERPAPGRTSAVSVIQSGQPATGRTP